MQAVKTRFSSHLPGVLGLTSFVVLILILGTIVSVASAAGTYDVSDYGARGDGSSDDTAAVQRAIDAAAATSGTVSFHGGTYRVSSALRLRSGVTLAGVPGESVLYMSAKGALTPLLYGHNLQNTVVQDLTLRSDGPTSQVLGVSMDGISGGVLRRLRFEGLDYG